MSVIASDLATYLGADVDEDRATQVLTLATNLCSTIVNPVPDAANAVILSAAARAYVNPTSTTAQMAGPYQVSGATGGVYLTKAERASLRRLAGSSGAFSVDLLAGYPDNRFPETP